MNSVVTAVIALISELLPLVNNSAQVARIIAALTEIIPLVVKVAQELVVPIKNIIAALQTNPATTAEQMAALKELDAKADADFEAAATGAEAEDAADEANATHSTPTQPPTNG